MCELREDALLYLDGVALYDDGDPAPCVNLPAFYVLGALVVVVALALVGVAARELALAARAHKPLFLLLLSAFAAVLAVPLVLFFAPQSAFAAWAAFIVLFEFTLAGFSWTALFIMASAVRAKSPVGLLGGPLLTALQLALAFGLGFTLIAAALGMAATARTDGNAALAVAFWRLHCAVFALGIPLVLVAARYLLLRIGADLRRMIPPEMEATRTQAETLLRRLRNFYLAEFYLNSVVTPVVFAVHAATLPGFSYVMFAHLLNALFFLANILYIITPTSRGPSSYCPCGFRRLRVRTSAQAHPQPAALAATGGAAESAPPPDARKLKIESLVGTLDDVHPAVARFRVVDAAGSAPPSTLQSKDVASAVVVVNGELSDAQLRPDPRARRLWRRVKGLVGIAPAAAPERSGAAVPASTALTFVEVEPSAAPAAAYMAAASRPDAV